MDTAKSKIKYVVCPDFVISQNDGDRHFVDAPTLMRLHHLKPVECIVVDMRRPETCLGRLEQIESLPHFFPRYGGEYSDE